MDDDEWQVERLDVDAYLHRIGWTGDLTATEDTLFGLHRAHRAAIPFENLDVVLGRGIDVDVEAVQRKLVGAERGGYCFEHGVLFSAVLQRAGFAVERMLARVGLASGPVRPRTHMCLRVSAGGRTWLADVGFGGGLLEPLPWSAGTRRSQSGWVYQLAHSDDRQWELREDTGDGPVGLYHFVAEAQHPIDVVVANHYICTHPRSPFVGKPIVLRKQPDQQLQLTGNVLTRSAPGEPDEKRDLSPEDAVAAIGADFGIQLTEAEQKGIAEAIRRLV